MKESGKIAKKMVEENISMLMDNDLKDYGKINF